MSVVEEWNAIMAMEYQNVQDRLENIYEHLTAEQQESLYSYIEESIENVPVAIYGTNPVQHSRRVFRHIQGIQNKITSWLNQHSREIDPRANVPSNLIVQRIP